jgi:ribosomal protein L21E
MKKTITGDKMEKEKTYYWEKFNPIDKWVWRNQSFLKSMIKRSFLGGSRVTGIKFDPSNEHFTYTASYHNRVDGWYDKQKKSYHYTVVLASLKERKQLEAGIISEENPMLKEFLEALNNFKQGRS